jgi:hypothetical protein
MQRVFGPFVLVACACLVAGCGGSSDQTKARNVARTMARNFGDPSVRTAQLYGPASYQVAFSAFSGGPTTPNQRSGRFYVIVLHGRFTGDGSTAAPTVSRLWSPTGHGGGTGFRRDLPASMSRLGRPTVISLR